jgi:hypothetical protein
MLISYIELQLLYFVVIISSHKQYEIFINSSPCLIILKRTVCELGRSTLLSKNDSDKFYDVITLNTLIFYLSKCFSKVS